MAVPNIFNNAPLFREHTLSLNDILTLPRFDTLTQANPAVTSYNNYINPETGQPDPNLGATWAKNVYEQAIRVGGRPVDFDFMFKMFHKGTKMTETKRFFNHYIGDYNYNITPAANVTGSGAGAATWVQISPANHGSEGTLSFPVKNMVIIDKEQLISYVVTDIDTSVDYAHKIKLTPQDPSVTVSLYQNKQYLTVPAALVGGYSCQQLMNNMQSIGWTQQLKYLRLKRNWSLTLDLLRGYRDKFQFPVIYDHNGKAMDSWIAKEELEANYLLKMAWNILTFMGNPVLNSALIANTGAVVDPDHTGFYGLLPSIEFGGGTELPYDPAQGFDFESDLEPLLLYQDSVKLSNKFLVLTGKKFMTSADWSTTKMVARSGVGSTIYEAYKRMGADSNDTTGLRKIGIKSYDYRDWALDFKEQSSFSDLRFIGSSKLSGTAIGMPMEGITIDGSPVDPIAFYEYGTSQATGSYESNFRDMRKITGCDSLEGDVAQSLGFEVKAPELWFLINPAY